MRRLPWKGHIVDWLGFLDNGRTLINRFPWEEGCWDTITGEVVRRFKRGDEDIPTGIMALTPEGKYLAVGYTDRVVFWDVATGQVAREHLTQERYLRGLAFSPDGKRYATTSHDQRIRVYDTATGKESSPQLGHGGKIQDIAVSPDGRYVASTSYEGATLIVWDPATSKVVWTRRWTRGAAGLLRYTPDGKQLIVLGWGFDTREKSLDERLSQFQHPARLLDAATGREVRQFPLKRLGGVTAALSPDGKLLVTGGLPGLQFWDLLTGKELPPLAGPEMAVEAVAISPDGKTLAVGGNNRPRVKDQPDRSARLWDLTTGELRTVLHGQTDSVGALRFSSDGRLLAAGANQESAVWEVNTGKLLWTPRIRGSAVRCGRLVFSPDSRLIASSGDWDARGLWDVPTGQMVIPLDARFCVFAPDGTKYITASENDTLEVWPLPPPRELFTVDRIKPDQIKSEEWQHVVQLLRDEDGEIAYQAVCALASRPETAVQILRPVLRVAPKRNVSRIQKLIDELDRDDFERRQDAVKALDNLGRTAEPELRAALQRPLSAEKGRQVRRLLETLETLPLPSPSRLEWRAIQVLESVGTQEVTVR
jgi:WD40 repeat protein